MLEAIGQESIKIQVSIHLREINELYNKLQSGENISQVPQIINAILGHIITLEQLDSKYYGFTEILRENIENCSKSGNGLDTDFILNCEPPTKGMRLSLYEVTCPLIERYCSEATKKISAELLSASKKLKKDLLTVTKANCELLFAYCLPQESILLLNLRVFCQQELAAIS